MVGMTDIDIVATIQGGETMKILLSLLVLVAIGVSGCGSSTAEAISSRIADVTQAVFSESETGETWQQVAGYVLETDPNTGETYYVDPETGIRVDASAVGAVAPNTVSSGLDVVGEEKVGPAGKKATEEKVGPAEKKAAEEKVGPAEKKAAEEKVGPAEKKATEEKVGPAEKKATEEKVGPAEKETTEEKLGPAEKKAAETQAAPGALDAPLEGPATETKVTPEVTPSKP